MESTEGMRQRIGGRDGKPAHQQRLACGFCLVDAGEMPLDTAEREKIHARKSE